MEHTGFIALIMGIVLCALGGYAIWTFLPEVIIAIKGLGGIVLLCIGLMMALFGILMVRD